MVVVIGTGAMAEALVAGLVTRSKTCLVVGRNEERLHELAQKFPIKTQPLKNFDITGHSIILAVKPYALKAVAASFVGKARICYSLLASTPISSLQEAIDADHYVRAMPNIAAAKQASMTALTGDVRIKEEALELFSAIGKTIWLDSEHKLDIATAIAGSGPAFLALVAEAIADGGVACGLTRTEAYTLTAGLFHSYAALTDTLPAQIKDRVMSPAGTTAAGYGILEEKGVRGAFLKAIEAATKRSER